MEKLAVVANWAQIISSIVAIFAILWAVYTFRSQRRQEAQRRQEIKKGILSALREEAYYNFKDILNSLSEQDLLAQQPDEPEHYKAGLLSPLTARFKLPDTALKTAIASGSYGVDLSPELLRELVEFNAVVEFVNQQIDELFYHQFSSPSLLGKACDVFRDYQRRGQLEKLHTVIRSRPATSSLDGTLVLWWVELAHRHWAIVNNGYHKRLFPAFRDIEEPLNQALKDVGLPPVCLHWSQQEQVKPPFAPSDLDRTFPVNGGTQITGWSKSG